MYVYTCQQCDAAFENKNKGKKFCSQKCAKLHSKKGVYRKCSFCGKMMYVPQNRLDRKQKQQFCSWECNMNNQHARRPSRICQHCGDEFKKKARYNAKFCCYECKQNSEENILQLANMRKKQCGRKINKLEKQGYQLLKEIGLVFEPQFVYAGRYVGDAFVPAARLLIQFDGDYWHGNQNKFPILSPQQTQQQEIDRRANVAAIKCGYKILRLWESDFKNQSKLRRKIERRVKNCREE